MSEPRIRRAPVLEALRELLEASAVFQFGEEARREARLVSYLPEHHARLAAARRRASEVLEGAR